MNLFTKPLKPDLVYKAYDDHYASNRPMTEEEIKTYVPDERMHLVHYPMTDPIGTKRCQKCNAYMYQARTFNYVPIGETKWYCDCIDTSDETIEETTPYDPYESSIRMYKNFMKDE